MMKTRTALLLLALAAGAAQAAEPSLQASEPRAYGYQVGDLVERRIVAHAPAGWRLDADSLPKAGSGRGRALELRRVELSSANEGDGQRHRIDLEYQVMLAPAAVRVVEIAPLVLRMTSDTRVAELRAEAWPVAVAPLVPVQAPTRRGLGELRPDRVPPLIDTRAARWRLAAAAVAAVLALTLLATIYLAPRWMSARRRPYEQAWRTLRRLPSDADDAAWQAACKRLHAALNTSAGHVLFAPGLAVYLADRPAYAPLREDLARFLDLSQRGFFAAAPRASGDAAWLVKLAQRLRDAERGLLHP